MDSILISIASFIVAVSIIVTVHEFGHFIVARALGVRVLRFSVGFGRALYSYVSPKTGVEYVLAAIPLGGYVKMLDEREHEVPPDQQALAFNRQSPYARLAIAAAGPLFNFIFAVLAYACMYVSGVQGVIPEIGTVQANSAAERAGLTRGDILLEINNNAVSTWQEASIELIDEGLKTGVVTIRKQSADNIITDVQLDLSDTKALLDEGSSLEKIGVQPWQPALAARLGKFTADSAARQQGLREGDTILSVNGEVVTGWTHWVELVQAHPNMRMDLQILRGADRLSMRLTPAAHAIEGKQTGKIGAYPWLDEAEMKKRRITLQEDVFSAFAKGVAKTLDMSVLTVKLLGRLITGEASVKNISGPIAIAEYAGVSAQLGLATFLSTLAIISISIGILNLLPVPILDGGHIMYCLVELVKGSPVSEAAQLTGQKVGVFMLAGLMSLAFYNDFQRLFG